MKKIVKKTSSNKFEKTNKKPKKTVELKPQPLDKTGAKTTIYIGNLSYKKTESDLKHLFQKFGKVTYVRLMLDQATKKSKGFAFIQMPNKEQALKAIESLDGAIIDERTLKVSIAQENEQPVFKRSKKQDDMDDEQEEQKPRRRKKIFSGLDILNKAKEKK